MCQLPRVILAATRSPHIEWYVQTTCCKACSSSRRNLPWIVFIFWVGFVESAHDISFQVTVSSRYALPPTTTEEAHQVLLWLVISTSTSIRRNSPRVELEGQGRPNAGEEPKKQKSRMVVGVQLSPDMKHTSTSSLGTWHFQATADAFCPRPAWRKSDETAALQGFKLSYSVFILVYSFQGPQELGPQELTPQCPHLTALHTLSCVSGLAGTADLGLDMQSRHPPKGLP